MGKVMLSALMIFILFGTGCSLIRGGAKAQRPEPVENPVPVAKAEPQSPKPQLISERSFLESVAAIEKEDPALRRVVGYSTPGTPIRLPAKVIQIYVAPYTTPLGRLVGEHFVYAVVQLETWWTPGSIGFDAIPPTDIMRGPVFREEPGQGEDR